ncbi:MAG: amidase family protein [Aquabacterium sp.]|jgi:amidase|uniref:amidase n=1 Tax=Aquabacterium sp. TaxID=1872578 RepID=UPI002A35E500|nr:amidase family protein [Aquabacterium sp.]MDX9843643.1 amidase family protein [Aquabacterium sp.]
MHFDDYQRYDALGLADLVRRGEVHPSELLDAALARADTTASLNAIVMRLDDSARARALAPFDPSAPFAGVPFLVKDLFQDLQGLPSSGGCRALKAVPAPEDADVVRRWREAGLVIFGKTNTPEFGAKNVTEPLAWGPARNPWDPTRTPGGSSGGSAAAVAAGIVPVAGANDGGGSIRIPAAACGLFGLKAGRGRISMGPMMGEALNGAAVQGVVSHSVRDTAAMLDVLQGPEAHAPYHMPAPEVPYLSCLQRPPGRLRIGYSTHSPIGTPVDPQAIAAVADAAALLTDLGHHVEPCDTPFNGVQLAEDFLLAWFCAQAFIIDHIQRTYGASVKDFEPDTRLMAAIGRRTSALQLLQCEARWHEHNLALSAFHARHDLWLSPTLAAPPPPIGSLATPPALAMVSDMAARLGLAGWLSDTPQFKQTVLSNLGWTPYTQLANLTGRPAMSVPLYRTPEGLPLGVQFVAPLNGEAQLLQLAAQLEAARPWRQAPRPASA